MLTLFHFVATYPTFDSDCLVEDVNRVSWLRRIFEVMFVHRSRHRRIPMLVSYLAPWLLALRFAVIEFDGVQSIFWLPRVI